MKQEEYIERINTLDLESIKRFVESAGIDRVDVDVDEYLSVLEFIQNNTSNEKKEYIVKKQRMALDLAHKYKMTKTEDFTKEILDKEIKEREEIRDKTDLVFNYDKYKEIVEEIMILQDLKQETFN